MKTYTKKEGEEYGFVAAIKLKNVWETYPSVTYFHSGGYIKAAKNVCTCVRAIREAPHLGKSLMAYATCENCEGSGIPPIPWPEVID